ncbi:uncharacterized protein LOC102801770 [Saccoglossus kowalevskii]|uniref:Neural cell adhesion molecule 1-like n=1 Tax=Saccoglossus kowalevskii TaxID=10224 RepID=A0ABM0LYX7_SACKO|nr:PREDICTED: neural cell adhesion molecule 1-like [Saccoglossus kowalevskii]
MGTKYNLQWITPKDGGMEIRFYELKYRELFFAEDGSPQGSGFWKDKSGIPNYSTDYLIEDLKPETSYDVELLAINSIGRGDVAALTISTGRTAPTVGPTKPRLVDYTIKPGPQIGTAALTTGAIIGIVIAIFFLLLIIVDVTCYCMNDCGILMCLCVNLCGKTPVGEKDMEEGRTKVPPSDDQIPDGTPVKGDDMPMEKIETDGDSTEKPPPEDSFDSEGKEEDVHNYEELKEEEPEPLESDHLLTDKDNPEERKESNETGDDEKESLLKGKDQNNPDAKPAEVQRENPALTPDQEPKKGPEDYEVSREADLNDIDMDVKKEVQA